MGIHSIKSPLAGDTILALYPSLLSG